MAATTQPGKGPADVTLGALSAVLGQVLGTDYEGVRSGRVRDLPDARTIRWYQTLGMVDRPAAFRGRTALYGRRHVLQLAAIKRLQAGGVPLADIQRALAGRTDAELARAARLRLADVDHSVAAASVSSTLRASLETPAAGRRAAAFWKASAASPRPIPVMDERAGVIHSLSLEGGVALVWSGRPLSAAERETAARLSRPLIEFLSSHGVGTTAESARNAARSSARHDQHKGGRA